MSLRISTICILLLLVVSACGGGATGPAAVKPAAAVDPGPTDLEVHVFDVTHMPIGGATVTVVAGAVEQEAATDASGMAEFPDLPKGETTVSVRAAGFEPETATVSFAGGSQLWDWQLNAEGAWAIGSAIVLGTHMVERADDGSSMKFSVDMAVIDGDSQALETLTSADFSVVPIDCGWGGPRECASDAEGNTTGDGGYFSVDGDAQAFALQPPSARHPYLVRVLAERSDAMFSWDQRAPALKTLFAALGGNDAASLASVQTENGVTTLTVLGPYTSDGATYFDAIDQLAMPAGSAPAILDSLTESIRSVAEAGSDGVSGIELSVLVLARQGLTTAEIDALTSLAVQSGVRISSVDQYGEYGLPEVAVRTGGFVVQIGDPRQLGMIFGAMDQLLAGTTSYYRMQFRLTGGRETFVSGGNVKIKMRIDVPTSIPNNGVLASLDVAIP